MSGSRLDDVRLSGFRQRAEVVVVLALLDSRVAPLPSEATPLEAAAGRMLAEAVVSTVNVPAFARSAMDGFALRAADTSPPRELAIIGDALPARPFTRSVQTGEAVRITTGAPIPAGADAVLMTEFAQVEADARVLPRAPVASGKHVVRVGEDVAKGSTVLPAGRKLRPQDVGLLASIGAASVRCVRKPRVAILVTGNELLPPGTPPTGYQIVDSNSPMLSALAARDGAEVLPVRRIPDDPAAIRTGLLAAAVEADAILVSGGTSVGAEDHTPRIAAELGELAVHGVAIRPAAPLGIAFLPVRSTSLPLFLIPGNPVACLCTYDLFAGRVLRRLGGRSWELPYRRLTLPLASEIVSAAGRVDYVRVKLEAAGVVPLATGGAGNLSNTVAADGFTLVPPDRDRLAPGEAVDVWLYE